MLIGRPLPVWIPRGDGRSETLFALESLVVSFTIATLCTLSWWWWSAVDLALHKRSSDVLPPWFASYTSMIQSICFYFPSVSTPFLRNPVSIPACAYPFDWASPGISRFLSICRRCGWSGTRRMYMHIQSRLCFYHLCCSVVLAISYGLLDARRASSTERLFLDHVLTGQSRHRLGMGLFW